jgi:hypothetical protein
VKEVETNISESAALSVDAAAYGKSQARPATLAPADRAASPDGAAFGTKASQIFFGRHVFDTVLSKIP